MSWFASGLLQVSSAFLDINRPANSLMVAGRKGRRPEEAVARLKEQTETLLALAAAVGQLFSAHRNDDPELELAGGSSLVGMAARQMDQLSGQLANAVSVLAAVPQSKAAAENAALFQVAQHLYLVLYT